MLAMSFGATGCLSVESEFTEVELKHEDLRIPSVASWVTAPNVTFEHPYSTLELPPEVDTELRPLRCTLKPREGVGNLDFILSFRLVMSAPGSDLPPVEMFAFRRDEHTPPGPALTARAVEQPNVLDYWGTGSTTYTLSIGGQLPNRDFSLDVSALFYGEAKLDL